MANSEVSEVQLPSFEQTQKEMGLLMAIMSLGIAVAGMPMPLFVSVFQVLPLVRRLRSKKMTDAEEEESALHSPRP